MKSKILLINVKDWWLTNGGDRPSLGTLYLASWLKHTNSGEPQVIDMNHHSYEALEKRINDFKPDYVGISLTTPQYVEAVKVAEYIKERYNIPIITGGPHPTAMRNVTKVPDLMPVDSFDYVVVGAGEKALEKICSEGLPRERIIFGEEAIKGKNLDWLPVPDRDLVDMNKYTLSIMGKKATPIMTSFGCPWSCVFCSEPLLNPIFKSYSPEKVVSEMEMLKVKYDMGAFIIYDDVFSINPKRAIAIADLMKERGLDLIYRCTTRATDFIKYPELAKKLKDSGCLEICIGLESADDGVLKLNDKGMTVENNRRGIESIKEGEIKCLTYLITGLPGCSRETEEKSLEFIKEVQADETGWYLLAPFPSTPLWVHREKYGVEVFEDEIITHNWNVAQARAENEKLTCYVDYSKSGGLNRHEIKNLWLEMRDKLDLWQRSRGMHGIQYSDEKLMDTVK